MKRRWLSCLLLVVMVVGMISGCGDNSKNPKLNTEEKITLTVGGAWEDLKALEKLGQNFTEKYPNCTIEYEYIQDYYNTLAKRLPSDENKLDLFFSSAVQENSVASAYALELYSQKELDLSDTYEGLLKNFEYIDDDDVDEIYCIPIGAEMRGMYVNKTLLKSLNLEIPKNSVELLNACKVLSEKGFIPFQGNPGSFSQQLLYPYVCNLIANSKDYEKLYDQINKCEAGVSQLFAKPMAFMYSLVENNYYNYKYIENEFKMFKDTSNEGISRSFLNIVPDGEDDYKKKDDVGCVAFMPGTISSGEIMQKMKEDYHSEIDYDFILAPVSEEGGFAYASPAHGIAINKGSDNVDWAVEFLDFFFEEENNKEFAEGFNIIPNTKDVLTYIEKKYDVKKNQVSQLGQVTFDYPFYNIIMKSLTEVSKANNPKYMKDNTNMYDYNYYMDRLEKRFEGQRTGSDLLGNE